MTGRAGMTARNTIDCLRRPPTLQVAILLALCGCRFQTEHHPKADVSARPADAKQSSALGNEAGGVPNLPSPRSALPLPLRIATYNINWGNARIEEVVSAIQQSDADIVCLQETNAQSAATLRQVFSRQYPTIRFFGSVERYAAAGFGLLSRIPLRSEKFLPAEDGLFGACLVELDTGDPAAQILNVHLQPVIFDRPRDEVGLVHVRDAFLNAERIHLREIKHLLTHIDPDSPSLILGDFNSLSSFQAPSFLRDRGYLDSFAGTVNGPDAHPT